MLALVIIDVSVYKFYRVIKNKKRSDLNIRDPNFLISAREIFFYLTANGVLPGGSGNTVSHNTQNNPSRSNKAAHRTTQQ
jgi:hypothetical protein